ncbi:putative PKHD-type hydroxylase [Senna tora]|uniref:Putative PKHD-type hydroxylase n=1 Tax=Senna tora TaxID=362788 RepID=A0A834SJE7_9FABA|nr:putative PKHD-type hydroxylase [Senna tora]
MSSPSVCTVSRAHWDFLALEVGGSTLDTHRGFVVEYGKDKDVVSGVCGQHFKRRGRERHLSMRSESSIKELFLNDEVLLETDTFAMASAREPRHLDEQGRGTVDGEEEA